MHFGIGDLAYIDPASGTIVLQAIIAGFVGLLWKVMSLFGRRKQEKPGSQPVTHAVVRVSTETAEEHAGTKVS